MKSTAKMMTAGGSIAIAAAVVLPAPSALAVPRPTTAYDLTQYDSVVVPGEAPPGVSDAIFENFFDQPTGTGVFQPFLTLEREAAGGNPSYYEQAYNTDGAPLYLDELRNHWNTTLKVGDLAETEKNGAFYYCFILDANEPGKNKSLISIDNIRIYTSAMDNTANVGDDLSKLDDLGDLRWAMNDPVLNLDTTFNDDPWVLLDADQDNVLSNSNGGSGKADMILYVPVSAFAGASDADYLWFYNLNGVKYEADSTYGAEAGYEEWKACVKTTSVPDNGTTLGLFGLGLLAVGLLGRNLQPAKAS